MRALPRTVGAGKAVGPHYYAHRSLLPRLPPPVREAVARAARAAPGCAWNVLKLKAHPAPAVSLLDYPGFWDEPEPALAHACTVDLASGRVVTRDYQGDDDAWILHRKELFVAPDEPRAAAARARTRSLEARGLFRDPSRIGRKRAWEAALRTHPNPPREPSACFSEKTSLRQVPALTKALVARGLLRRGMVNADIGGGRFEDVDTFLRRAGIENLRYDCQLPRAHNAAVLARLARGGAHTATVANVLNVIPDAHVRREVLTLAREAVAPGGVVWVAVYEGDRGGRGRTTPKGWQAHRPLASYLAEVRAALPRAALDRVGHVAVIRAPV